MVNPVALGLGGLSLAMAALFGFFAQRHGKRSRLIGATEEVDLGKLRGGFVKVRGRVKFGPATVVSPITEKPCAYFRFEVQRLTGGRVKRWVRVFADERGAPFFLEDKTGQGRVDLAGAEVKLAAESGWGEDEDLPPSIAARIRQLYGRDFQSVFSSGTRYAEAVLEEGEKIFVVGTSVLGDDGRYVVRKADSLCVASDEDEGAIAYQANHNKYVGYFQAGAAALFGLLLIYLAVP